MQRYVVRSSHERSYSTLSPVSTGMGDRLRVGTPPRYITNQATRSTQSCIPSGSLNLAPALNGQGKSGNVTSAGCDPIWHVSFRSGETSCTTAIHVYKRISATPAVVKVISCVCECVCVCVCVCVCLAALPKENGLSYQHQSRQRYSPMQALGIDSEVKTSKVTASQSYQTQAVFTVNGRKKSGVGKHVDTTAEDFQFRDTVIRLMMAGRRNFIRPHQQQAWPERWAPPAAAVPASVESCCRRRAYRVYRGKRNCRAKLTRFRDCPLESRAQDKFDYSIAEGFRITKYHDDAACNFSIMYRSIVQVEIKCQFKMLLHFGTRKAFARGRADRFSDIFLM